MYSVFLVNCITLLPQLVRVGFAGLDVVRTDRPLVYYENEANQAKLWNVLAIYTWVDNDIGYVQGDKLYSLVITSSQNKVSFVF